MIDKKKIILKIKKKLREIKIRSIIYIIKNLMIGCYECKILYNKKDYIKMKENY